MKFSELRQRLTELAGDPNRPWARPEVVQFDRYDHGREDLPFEDVYVIDIIDGRYQIGYFERGALDPRETFDTEDEACDWLYAHLTRPEPPAAPISQAELDAVKERMRRRYEGS